MRKQYFNILAVVGFIGLFLLYQAAEVCIRFYNNIPLFLALMLLTIVAGYFLTKKLFSRSIFVYNSTSLKSNSIKLILGLAIGVATYLCAYFIAQSLSLEVPGRHPDLRIVATELLIFIAGTLLPSLAEDILTRGYLFTLWPQKYSRYAFILFSATVYALNHIYAFGSGPALLIYLFITGVSLAIPIILTGSIWYTFGLHWACNIIYRMSNDIFQTNQVADNPLSSLTLLCIVVACFIPINILVIRKFIRPSSSPLLHN